MIHAVREGEFLPLAALRAELGRGEGPRDFGRSSASFLENPKECSEREI